MMKEYITFDQLADELRRYGKARTLNNCNGCAYYRGPNHEQCIPKMTARAAQVIELFAAEEPKKEGDPSDLRRT